MRSPHRDPVDTVLDEADGPAAAVDGAGHGVARLDLGLREADRVLVAGDQGQVLAAANDGLADNLAHAQLTHREFGSQGRPAPRAARKLPVPSMV